MIRRAISTVLLVSLASCRGHHRPPDAAPDPHARAIASLHLPAAGARPLAPVDARHRVVITRAAITVDDVAEVASWNASVRARVASWLRADGGGSAYATAMPVETSIALDPGGVVREVDRRRSEGGFMIRPLRLAAEGLAEIERGHALATGAAFAPSVAVYADADAPAPTVAAVMVTMQMAGFSQAEFVLRDARGRPGAVVVDATDEPDLAPDEPALHADRCHPTTVSLGRDRATLRGDAWSDAALEAASEGAFRVVRVGHGAASPTLVATDPAAEAMGREGSAMFDRDVAPPDALATVAGALRREGHVLCPRLRVALEPGVPWTGWLDVASVARPRAGFDAVDLAP